MTEKELRRLSRADLLEMLIAQSEELRDVKERLKSAEAILASRVIEINTAGSIAEASLRLNGVFEAAQADKVYVMSRGRIVMEGAPKDVFSKVDALRAEGLSVPDTTGLIHKLNKSGYSLPEGLLTVEECAQAVLKAMKQ